VYPNFGQEIRVFGRRDKRNGNASGGLRDQSVPRFTGGVLRAPAVETDANQSIQGFYSQ